MSVAHIISLYGPAALILLALLWGFARILYLARTSGVSVLAFTAQRKTPAEIGLVFFAIILDGYLLLRPVYPALDSLVGLYTTAYGPYGVAFMAIGIALAVLSQIDMGKSWRIGVPKTVEDSQKLITGGLYAYSRNPIYLGIVIFLAGAVIVAPSFLTAGCFCAVLILVQQVIRREEIFMTATFGADYERYRRTVRRWL